jgi:hypothetical protein
MEVIMKKTIYTFVSVILFSVLAIVSANAQSFGTRVEANIPFDFTVGNKTFQAGNYELSITRNNVDLYSVSLRDESGRSIFRTTALRSAQTSETGAKMIFSVVGNEHYLKNIATPEIAYSFNGSYKNKQIAEAKQLSVPAAGAPQL